MGLRIETRIYRVKPRKMHGKVLKRFYRAILGYLPDNWREHPNVKIRTGNLGRVLDQVEFAVRGNR